MYNIQKHIKSNAVLQITEKKMSLEAIILL